MTFSRSISFHFFGGLLLASALACAPQEGERTGTAATPLTGDGACAHPLCEEGGAIDASCHSCAATICQADPFCCTTAWDSICTGHVESICNESCEAPPTCGHDICEEGEALDASCGDCAAQICAVDPFCCSSGWDSICVGEVQSVCGQSCSAPECAHPLCETGDPLDPACDSCAAQICAVDPYCCSGQWDRICTAQVETVCQGSCEAPSPECEHAPCTTGGPLDPDCDECVESVCQADPFCCNVAWDQLCVNAADTSCGAQTPPQADILFIVDTSCSMTEEQSALSSNFRTLLDHVQNQGVDFHIAVTTTDVDAGGERGAFTGPIITPSTPDPDGDFASAVLQGTNGSPIEQGLEAARLALSQPQLSTNNAGFLRSDASLTIIFLSDEDDQSPDAVADYVSFLQGLKSGPPVTLNSIVGDTPQGCQGPSGSASAGLRYLNGTNSTGGAFSSICGADWSAALTNVPASGAGFCGP